MQNFLPFSSRSRCLSTQEKISKASDQVFLELQAAEVALFRVLPA